MVATLPKIDGAVDVCDEKAFDVPNALPEKRPPLLFAFSDTFGLQMAKSLKIEPTSDEAVVAAVAAGGCDAMVAVAVEGVPKPPKTEPAFVLAGAAAKLNVVGLL